MQLQPSLIFVWPFITDINIDNQLDATITINNSNQLNMFRAMISPILRITRLCRLCYSLWYNAPTMLPNYEPAESSLHYTTSCNKQSSAPEDGRNHRLKHVELNGIINKPLLVHLVGCLYYFNRLVFYDDSNCSLLLKYAFQFQSLMLSRSRFSLVFLVLDEMLSWHTNFHVAHLSHTALPIPTSKFPFQRSPQGVQNCVIMQPFKRKIQNAAQMHSLLILNALYLSSKSIFTRMTREELSQILQSHKSLSPTPLHPQY